MVDNDCLICVAQARGSSSVCSSSLLCSSLLCLGAPVQQFSWRCDPCGACLCAICSPVGLMQGCPGLRRLVLRHCGAVTDAGVRSVALPCKLLQASGGAGHCCAVNTAVERGSACDAKWCRDCPFFQLASPHIVDLQEVVLEHTAVGDAGLLQLSQLPHLRRYWRAEGNNEHRARREGGKTHLTSCAGVWVFILQYCKSTQPCRPCSAPLPLQPDTVQLHFISGPPRLPARRAARQARSA